MHHLKIEFFVMHYYMSPKSVKKHFLKLVSANIYKRPVTEDELTEVDAAVLKELVEREESKQRKEQEMLKHATKASPIRAAFTKSVKPSRHEHTRASKKRTRSASRSASRSPGRGPSKHRRYNHNRETVASTRRKRTQSASPGGPRKKQKSTKYQSPLSEITGQFYKMTI